MCTFTYQSIQTAGSTFALPARTKYITISSGASLWFKHSPPGIHLSVVGYLHRQGISVLPYLKEWLVHHPDYQVVLCHQFQLLTMLRMVGFKLNIVKSELKPVKDIQFLGIQLHVDLGRAILPDSKAWKIVAHTYNISSKSLLSF